MTWESEPSTGEKNCRLLTEAGMPAAIALIKRRSCSGSQGVAAREIEPASSSRGARNDSGWIDGQRGWPNEAESREEDAHPPGYRHYSEKDLQQRSWSAHGNLQSLCE
jgi:hypothetical protein